MRILVTGATGAIGKVLVKALSKEAYDLAILVRNPDVLPQYFSDDLLTKLKVIPCLPEISEASLIDFNPEAVIHLAAYSTSRDDAQTIQELIATNISFGSDLLSKLSKCDLKYFINTGSSTEYFENMEELNPTYFYSATKTAFRSILDYFRQLNNFKVVNSILFSVYGTTNEGKKIFDYLLDGLNSEEPVNVSPGLQELDFIHIDDVVSYYLTVVKKLLSSPAIDSCELFVGTGETHSLRKVATTIERLTGKKLWLNWGGVSYRERDMLYAKAPMHKNEGLIEWRSQFTIETGVKKWLKEKINFS